MTFQSCVVLAQLHNTSLLLNQVNLEHKKSKIIEKTRCKSYHQNKGEHSVDVVIREFGIRI